MAPELGRLSSLDPGAECTGSGLVSRLCVVCESLLGKGQAGSTLVEAHRLVADQAGIARLC